SIRATARRTSARARAATMKGNAASVLKTGMSSGMPIAHPKMYDTAVATTIADAIMGSPHKTESPGVDTLLTTCRLQRAGTSSAPKYSSYRDRNSSHVYEWL